MSFTIKAAFDGSAVDAGLRGVGDRVRVLQGQIGAATDVGKAAKQSLADIARSLAGFAAPVASFVAGLRIGNSIFSEYQTKLADIANSIGRIVTGFNQSLLSPDLSAQADRVGKINDELTRLQTMQSKAPLGNEDLFGLGQGNTIFGNILRGVGVLPELSGEDESRLRSSLSAEARRQGALAAKQRDAAARAVADRAAVEHRAELLQRLGSSANSVDAFGREGETPEEALRRRFESVRGSLLGLKTEDFLSGGSGMDRLGNPVGGIFQGAIDAQLRELGAAFETRLDALTRSQTEARDAVREQVDAERELAEIEALRLQGREREAEGLRESLRVRQQIRALERLGASSGVDVSSAIAQIQATSALRLGGLTDRSARVSSASAAGFDASIVARSFLGGSAQERIAASSTRQVALAEQANRHLETIASKVSAGGGGLA